ncbi:sulfotransferase family protein [Pedobacter sp. MC2016-14]|uniref:sulfotransferase family 2 domain-containing protein n=1 Tax=Pedobacter sp. MC2016-14 TaxID=2897327 RepID=UPI001E3FEA81|nr:sulfotransferase family 2 domain-containing protein [Pedobacter sp. MC2016-14]MCD0486918.1 sulfotransferase family protein [Pedobacter sp. MC2016-14]
MIISHKHKFIFFAIPKTGTHSIRFALRPFLDVGDEEHVHLFKQSKLSVPQFKDRADGHLSVEEIRPFISDQIWNSYFKFCFVRNPWDRFVSTVFYRHKKLIHSNESKLDFFNAILTKHWDNPGLFYKPQSSFIVDERGFSTLDFIGKTESIQSDFNEICNRINLPMLELDQRNSSPHEVYTSYYDEVIKNRVSDFYKRDIEMFDYTFDK